MVGFIFFSVERKGFRLKTYKQAWQVSDLGKQGIIFAKLPNRLQYWDSEQLLFKDGLRRI